MTARRMRRGRGAPGRDAGFTYIGVLALVVAVGIFLAAAGQVTRTAMIHEHEDELLAVGRLYRDAIGRYMQHYHHFPNTLAELTGPTADPSAAGQPGADGPLVYRAMRRLYPDPMTHAVDWITIPAPDGSIMGIASRSNRVPLKVAGFEDDEEDFDKAETYQDWKFVYQPQARRKPRPALAAQTTPLPAP